MSADLEPLAPSTAADMYLEARSDELADETLQSQEYSLRAFLAWCEEEGVASLDELNGRDLYEYRIWRREGNYADGEELATISLRGDLSDLRAFLHFAADVDAVPESMAEQVPLPSVSGAAGVSDTTLNPERAERILDYLSRYEYASRKHTTVLLLWHTGARVGAVRGLDVDDVDLDDDAPGVEFRHRPGTGTPLKNGEKGERWNAISRHVATVVRDYVEDVRRDVTEESGRRPLLTTREGRPAVSTLRDTLYAVTRPCWLGDGCPHDRDPDECEATFYSAASKCPSSRSPHDVRSGRVTAYRREDVPRRVVSDRLNASEDILDKHYDRRSRRERAEQRRDFLPDS